MLKHATYLTNKKLLLSLATVAGAVFLISVGIWIENKIVDGAERKAQMYQTALQTQSDEQLNYSIDTQQGRVLAQVTVEAVDLVKFDEMNKSFPAVYKEEETYTKHSRTVCSYDEDGNVKECHAEYYYTWDTTDSWSLEAQKVKMAGREYPRTMFALPYGSVSAKDIIDGETGRYVVVEKDHFFDVDIFSNADEGDKRYSYLIINLPQSGSVFLNTTGALRAVFGGHIALDVKTPQELVKQAQNSAHTEMIVLRIFWTILVVGQLGSCLYLVWIYQPYY
jgi:hypothetical protein